MTSVKFLADKNGIRGFEISGHCSTDSDDETGKIVCAAVSSAAYMAVNTITEIIGAEGNADISDAFMHFTLKGISKEAVAVLEGLRFHIEELSGQYGNNIKIIGGAKDVKD